MSQNALVDWSGYIVGGATRPDAISGLNDNLSMAIWQMINDAPPEVRQQIKLTSGYRSPEVQAGLYEAAVKKYGKDGAGKWVAAPGKSNHNHGNAVDFKYLDDTAKEWVHANAPKYNLHFPMDWEPWHVEYNGTAAPQNALAGQPAPQAPQNALAAAQAPHAPQWQYRANLLDPAAFMSRRNNLSRFT